MPTHRTDDELHVLRIFEEILFGGLLRGNTPDEWRERCTTGDLADALTRRDGTRWAVPPYEDHCLARFDVVPDYIGRAVAYLRGVSGPRFDAALRSLESLGDVEVTGPHDHFGTWVTSDGKRIEVSPGPGWDSPDDLPFWVHVAIDGHRIHSMWGNPKRKGLGRGVRLTQQGRTIVRNSFAAAEPVPAEPGERAAPNAGSNDGWYPAGYYKNFNIFDDRLRQAALKGRIRKTKRNGTRNFYHIGDVRELWPHLIPRDNARGGDRD